MTKAQHLRNLSSTMEESIDNFPLLSGLVTQLGTFGGTSQTITGDRKLLAGYSSQIITGCGVG